METNTNKQNLTITLLKNLILALVVDLFGVFVTSMVGISPGFQLDVLLVGFIFTFIILTVISFFYHILCK